MKISEVLERALSEFRSQVVMPSEMFELLVVKGHNAAAVDMAPSVVKAREDFEARFALLVEGVRTDEAKAEQEAEDEAKKASEADAAQKTPGGGNKPAEEKPA